MSNATPGEGFKLSEAQLTWLDQRIHEQVVALESDHAQYFSDINTWWRWFEATPRFAQKDFPFKNASNVVVPLIQSHVITLVNRLLGMIFGDQKIWMARTQNTETEDIANSVVAWLNWAANGNDFDLTAPITDWLTEMIAVGSSVLALNWRNDVRHVVVGNGGRNMRTKPVSFGRGPIVEHVTRLQILWNTRYAVHEAPLVAREFQLAWSEVNAIASGSPNTGWLMKRLESVQGEEGLSAQAHEARQRELKHDRIQESTEPHDFREVWCDWPAFKSQFDGDDVPNKEALGHPSPTIVVTYHYKTQTVVRVRTSPYNLPGKPFFSGFYRKRPGRSHGVGLCKDLFSMQDSETVLLNQAIDSRTRSNMLWAKTSNRAHLSKPIDPRHPVHVGPGELFEPLQFDKSVLNDVNLFNVVNVVAERLTGQADPVMGRESRSGGHPSPATSTLALLGQSDQMIGALRMTVRGTIGKLGESIAVLYQQFETNEDGRLERTVGQQDAATLKEYLFPIDPIPGNIVFDVVGMSQTQNPQAEISRNIQLAQMNTNYWSFVSNIIQMVAGAQAQNPQMAQMLMPIAQQAIKAQTRFQERLLEAGSVDDIEEFTLAFKRDFRQSQTDLLGASQQLGALGDAGQPVQQPGMGGPPQSTGGGTLVAPGGFGG